MLGSAGRLFAQSGLWISTFRSAHVADESFGEVDVQGAWKDVVEDLSYVVLTRVPCNTGVWVNDIEVELHKSFI